MFAHVSSGFRPLFALYFAAAVVPAAAHVDWTRVNASDADTIGLYHFNETATGAGDALSVAPGVNSGQSLQIQALLSGGAGFASVADVHETFFGPGALRLDGTQRADSIDEAADVESDLTIECWLKWNDAPSASDVRVGLRSGLKLRIARDTANPANDYFGLLATHGDTVVAPGFTNWVAVGTEEAPLGEWLHFAAAIHPTGAHFDSGLGHDVYDAGSVARIYLNGHAVGASPHTVDITGMRIHDESMLTIDNVSGSVEIDELTVWRYDWSQNGTAATPFADGRGVGLQSAAKNWNLYE